MDSFIQSSTKDVIRYYVESYLKECGCNTTSLELENTIINSLYEDMYQTIKRNVQTKLHSKTNEQVYNMINHEITTKYIPLISLTVRHRI